MASTTYKEKDLPGVISRVTKKLLEPKPEPFPDFWKPNYTPNSKRKTVERMPFKLPERLDPNIRIPADQVDQLKPEIKKIRSSGMGNTEDLGYKQPAWLTKILDEPAVDQNARILRRQKVMDQLGTEMKKSGAPKAKIRGLIRTGRVNQDSQLNQIDQ